jgi:hypothetical protein
MLKKILNISLLVITGYILPSCSVETTSGGDSSGVPSFTCDTTCLKYCSGNCKSDYLCIKDCKSQCSCSNDIEE